MNKKRFDTYCESTFKAIIYIQNNIEENIDLSDIAKEAGYSLYHFHRIFKKVIGESLKSYIRRIRLENAAFSLQIQNKSIIDIALDSGFYTPETFSKAFNKYFGKLPSKYKNEVSLYNDSNINSIKKVYFKGRMCIFKRHTGLYTKSGTPYEKNSLWHSILLQSDLKSKNVLEYELFGISHDDPSITSEKNIRYDACIAVKNDEKTASLQQQLQEGFYIVAVHQGSFEELIQSYNYLIYTWLKKYNFIMNHKIPPFEQFCNKHIKIYIPIL